jgi:hypothetical protein
MKRRHTLLDYKKNFDIVKELHNHSRNLENITDVTGKPTLFEFPAPECHSKFSVVNQNDDDLWEDPLNAGTRWLTGHWAQDVEG